MLSATDTSVALIDDHPLVGLGLQLGLGQMNISARVVAAESTAQLLDDLTTAPPELVVLDYGMPRFGDGLSLIAPIRAIGSRVVVLSGSSNRVALASCIEAGAECVISKDEPIDRILQAIRDALENRSVNRAGTIDLITELATERQRQNGIDAIFSRLSAREQEILGGMMEGLSAGEMARRDCVSMDTTRSHIASVLRKLGAHSQLEAVAFAYRSGWRPSTRTS